MGCKPSAGQIANRLQFKVYQGKASAVIGASTTEYAYCLSDTVPDGKFWEVFYASGIILAGAGTQVNRVGLWMMRPGILPANNQQTYQNNPNVFQGATALSVNGPPVGPGGIRVDELDDGVSTDEYAKNAERVLIKSRKLLVPSGWTLMCYGGSYGNGNGGAVGEQFQLQIVFVEFSQDENVEIDF
jgi:hypothetical protein